MNLPWELPFPTISSVYLSSYSRRLLGTVVKREGRRGAARSDTPGLRQRRPPMEKRRAARQRPKSA